MKSTPVKAVAALLAIVMALSVLPTFAHGTEGGFEDSACVIGLSAFYDNLPAAVNAATDGEVITVLKDLKNQKGLWVAGKRIIINGSGCLVDISDDNYGIYVANGGSLTFTNGHMGVDGGKYGIYAIGGGKVDIWGNVIGYDAGIYATGEGTSVKVNGAVQNWSGKESMPGFKGIGAYAGDHATVIIGGSVDHPLTGINYGAFAETGGYIEYKGSLVEGEKHTGAHAESGGKIDLSGTMSRLGTGGAAFGKLIGAYADGKGSVVNVTNNAAGGSTEGGVGAWARNGGVVTAKFANGYIGVLVDQELELKDLLQPLDYYSTVKIETSVNANGKSDFGILNKGGVVIVDGFVRGDVYVAIGEQTVLGTSEKEFEKGDKMEPPARFAGEYPKEKYYWYYNDGPLSHSFTIIRTEGQPCGIGELRYDGFRSAMAAVQNGQTITLYKDCRDMDIFDISNKNFTINLNDNDLTVDGFVRLNDNSVLTIKGKGEIKFEGGLLVGTGSKVVATDPETVFNTNVSASNGSITVPNAKSVNAGSGGTITVLGDVKEGVTAQAGGKITVGGNVTGSSCGAYASGNGSSITINGWVEATADDGTAVKAENQAKIIVKGSATAKKIGVSATERELTAQGSWDMDDAASVTVGGKIKADQTGVVIEGGRVLAESGITAPTFAVLPALEGLESRPDQVLEFSDDLDWDWDFWDKNYVGEYGTYNKYYYIEYEHTDAYGNPLMDEQYLDENGNPLVKKLHSHLLVNTIPQEDVVAQTGDGRNHEDFEKAIASLNREMALQASANAGKPDDERRGSSHRLRCTGTSHTPDRSFWRTHRLPS